MKKISFSVTINAPKEKVWKILWDDKTYRQWTSVFSEGSYAVSDWNEGDRVHFLSGTGDGMFSEIAKKTDNEIMSFRHLGVVKDGKEQPSTPETETWIGATETYTLSEDDKGTSLVAELQIIDQHAEYFEKTFPLALDAVKNLAEEQ